MKVSELAQAIQTTPDTVRFYTRAGFLKPSKNQINGYKQYSVQDRARLKFIVSARQLGFSVTDIKQILSHAEKGDSACPMVRHLIQQRLEQTEEQFQQSKALREKMQTAILNWQMLPDKEPTNEMICHLIEEFEMTSSEEQ